jgi:hypothetical protein
MQGRTAQYGTRHLLQVVAVKRRQAEGRSLAEIQAELAGATDEILRRAAAVPDELIAADSARPQQPPLAAHPGRRGRFWADRPAAAEPVALGTGGGADAVTTLAAVSLPGGALLLLPADHSGRPDEDDIHAIHAAALPLLELLAGRGLLSLDERSPS